MATERKIFKLEAQYFKEEKLENNQEHLLTAQFDNNSANGIRMMTFCQNTEKESMNLWKN